MYAFPPRAPGASAPYAFLDPAVHAGAFTLEECRAIRDLGGSFEPGRTAGEQVTPYRDAHVAGLPLSDQTRWVFDRLAQAAMVTNAQFWGFDLFGIAMPSLQLIRYRSGQHHGWHRDGCDGAFATRKLSMTVQLSPPGDYEGGALEFFWESEPSRIPPALTAAGTILVWPAHLLHRVTPVTRGTRYALAVWIDGPPYR